MDASAVMEVAGAAMDATQEVVPMFQQYPKIISDMPALFGHGGHWVDAMFKGPQQAASDA